MPKPKITSDMLELKDAYQRITLHQLRDSLTESVRYVVNNSDPLVLITNGESCAALVSLEDLWILEVLGTRDIKAQLRLASRYEPSLLQNILRKKLKEPEGFVITRAQLLKDIRTLVRRLRERMREHGGNWRVVMAIARGGVFPARLIANSLQINDYREITISSYHGDEKLGRPRVMGKIKDEREGEGVLVVDDVLDTGDTALCINEMLPRCDLATVYTKPGGLNRIMQQFGKRHIYGKEMANKWIVFPWDQPGWDANWSPRV